MHVYITSILASRLNVVLTIAENVFLLLLYLYDYPHDHELLQDVEIKKMSGSATYGFVLFYDLMCAVAAKQFMDGENVHGNNIRVSSLYMYNVHWKT